MINRFALSFLCIELDRNEIYEVMLLYILLSSCQGPPLGVDCHMFVTCTGLNILNRCSCIDILGALIYYTAALARQ